MMQVRVSRVQALARDIVLLELQAADGRPLPGAEPGAHIDLHLPNGHVRQYSLTNALGQATQASYQVAVARDAHSRGGSAWIHDSLRCGAALSISAPRNLFALDLAHRKLLLIGGGIGLTPVYAMARAAQQRGLDWTLVACVRSGSRLAFQEELLALDAGRVRFHIDAEQGGPLDVAALLAGGDWDGVYACGPSGMLDAVQAATAAWPAGRARMERFKAEAQDASRNKTFELVLSRTGTTLQVAADESPLETLERAGIDHPFSCREGLCGTCEVGLIEGQAEHRDCVLDERERTAGQRFIPCVSRCGGARLVIDL